ncbi:MAG TPA: phospholipase D-like domain-containing protein [Candidatus Krumholzibacteria bacterium]|nr:phospholipase D-like domain-containing protein [Candidatus Krumholzibacteria bacterium]
MLIKEVAVSPLSRVLGFVLLSCLLGLAYPVPSRSETPEPVQLVESWPVETQLDNPAIPDAPQVWLQMVKSARERLDFAEFYASNAPDSLREAYPASAGRLEAVIEAIEAAAKRGVKVRFLAEKNFYKTYPTTLNRLDAQRNVELRIYDVGALMGGVLHAKYFLVDGHEAYLGSQNFDWRSLAHIQELGLKIDDPHISQRLQEVFDYDWARSNGEEPPPVSATPDSLPAGYSVAFSPTGFLPREADWDLPQIVKLLDGAQDHIRFQLLSYHVVGRDHSYWNVIDDALRRASARDVKVEMILANWSKGGSSMQYLKSLQTLDHVQVRIATIPQWSKGFIPFARVIHAKYLVVDGASSWVGTSNWGKSYFHNTRNVGLVMNDSRIAQQLEGFFSRLWQSTYVEDLDPCKSYERQRVAQ